MEPYNKINRDSGTTIEGGDEEITRKSISLDQPIDATDASHVSFDPRFKAYLTLFIHKGNPLTNPEYALQIKDPKNGTNGERKILPVSYSLNLVDILKKKDSIFKNGPAYLRIIRYESINDGYIGTGIRDLFKDFSKSINDQTKIRELEEILNIECNPDKKGLLDAVSRSCQFDITVPKDRTNAINIASPKPVDEKVDFYSLFRFSDQYKTEKNPGVKIEVANSKEKVEIKQNELARPNDKIVVGFGDFIGKIYEKNKKNIDIPNVKRRLLMYITPNELIPKL